jgi:ubiquitin carboxyl-terminal hydrolase 9/24
MNFETMRSVKLNDRLEFPLTLNMKPYTREGIHEQEQQQKGDGATATDDGKDDEQHPDSYYEYELTGVTVHTGSMDRGHYYSFIQERPTAAGQVGRWMEFNDTVVRPFDSRSIPDECCQYTQASCDRMQLV